MKKPGRYSFTRRVGKIEEVFTFRTYAELVSFVTAERAIEHSSTDNESASMIARHSRRPNLAGDYCRK